VQYLANGKSPRQPWIVHKSAAGGWIFAGTGLRRDSRFGLGSVEIDGIAASPPRKIEVLAEIQDLFGPGRTAQMTYYEGPSGARVFAAGAFYFARMINVDLVVSRIVENLSARMVKR
jgi:hypothetical protein